MDSLTTPTGYDDIVSRLKTLAGYLVSRSDYMLQGVKAAERGADYMPYFAAGGNLRKQFESEHPDLLADFNSRK